MTTAHLVGVHGESVTNELRTLDDLDVEGRRVLLRADLDVPLIPASAGAPVRVADDTRIRAALITIEELRRRGARVVLVSQLGRPKDPHPALSMRPVADRLRELTGASVQLADTVIGPRVIELTQRLQPGQILALENVRFEAGETRNDPALASALAELADLYVGDAFASAHRRDASTWGVARLLPCAAGRLMEREVHALDAVVERPARPLVIVVGGAKLREKFGVVRRFLELADDVCIGGAMCFPFLAALGHGVGNSLCPREDVESARTVLLAAPGIARRPELPRDLVLARWPREGSVVTRSLSGVDVPPGWMGLDIGAQTAARYVARVAGAATVFWSGPMGRFELPRFDAGTRAIAQAVASTPATTVVGGGETIEVLQRFAPRHRVGHVSTGGPAMLEFLEGRELPGVQVLSRRPALDPVEHGPNHAERVMTSHTAVG